MVQTSACHRPPLEPSRCWGPPREQALPCRSRLFIQTRGIDRHINQYQEMGGGSHVSTFAHQCGKKPNEPCSDRHHCSQCAWDTVNGKGAAEGNWESWDSEGLHTPTSPPLNGWEGGTALRSDICECTPTPIK